MGFLRQLWAELRLERRYGIYYAALAVMGSWALVLWPLPLATRVYLLPAVLVMDTAIFGLLLMPAMMFLEQNDRVLSAIVVTPLTTARYLLQKVAALTAIALVLSLALVALLVGAGVSWALLAAGVAMGSAMAILAGFVVASRFASITRFIMPSSVVLLLVQLPALDYFGFVESPLFYVLPTMAPLALVRGAVGSIAPWEVAYALLYGGLACALLLGWARRAFDRFVVGGQRRARRAAPARARRGPAVRRHRLAALAITDLRNIRRDPIILFLAGYAVVLALLGRWLTPWLIDRLSATMDFEPYALLLVTFLVVQAGPLILGAVAGLLLLDERDERSLTALRVTPLPMTHYALYRMAVPTALSVTLCFVGVYFVDVVYAPPLRVAAVALIAGLEAPIVGLAMASLATNKVEGLAMMKAMGIFMFGPLVAWFVAPPLRWLFGLVPTLWPAEAFWQAVEPRGSFWIVVIIGVATHSLLLWALLRRFRARV